MAKKKRGAAGDPAGDPPNTAASPEGAPEAPPGDVAEDITPEGDVSAVLAAAGADVAAPDPAAADPAADPAARVPWTDVPLCRRAYQVDAAAPDGRRVVYVAVPAGDHPARRRAFAHVLRGQQGPYYLLSPADAAAADAAGAPLVACEPLPGRVDLGELLA